MFAKFFYFTLLFGLSFMFVSHFKVEVLANKDSDFGENDLSPTTNFSTYFEQKNIKKSDSIVEDIFDIKVAAYRRNEYFRKVDSFNDVNKLERVPKNNNNSKIVKNFKTSKSNMRNVEKDIKPRDLKKIDAFSQYLENINYSNADIIVKSVSVSKKYKTNSRHNTSSHIVSKVIKPVNRTIRRERRRANRNAQNKLLERKKRLHNIEIKSLNNDDKELMVRNKEHAEIKNEFRNIADNTETYDTLINDLNALNNNNAVNSSNFFSGMNTDSNYIVNNDNGADNGIVSDELVNAFSNFKGTRGNESFYGQRIFNTNAKNNFSLKIVKTKNKIVETNANSLAGLKSTSIKLETRTKDGRQTNISNLESNDVSDIFINASIGMPGKNLIFHNPKNIYVEESSNRRPKFLLDLIKYTKRPGTIPKKAIPDRNDEFPIDLTEKVEITNKSKQSEFQTRNVDKQNKNMKKSALKKRSADLKKDAADLKKNETKNPKMKNTQYKTNLKLNKRTIKETKFDNDTVRPNKLFNNNLMEYKKEYKNFFNAPRTTNKNLVDASTNRSIDKIEIHENFISNDSELDNQIMASGEYKGKNSVNNKNTKTNGAFKINIPDLKDRTDNIEHIHSVWQRDDPALKSNFCPSRNPKEIDDYTIDIAVLVPAKPPENFTPCIKENVLPVVELAVKNLQESGLKGPLSKWNISVNYRDTNCSSTFGPLAAVDLHFGNKADVFLGPVCEYALAPVSRFASVWDTPVLTPGGHPQAFDYKENFASLTRLRGFDTEVSHVIKSIGDHFGWKLVGLLYEEGADSKGHSECHLQLSGVHDAFNKTSQNRGFVYGVDEFRGVMEYFKNKARVIVMCAQNTSIIRDLLLVAHDLQMTDGTFAFFSMELSTRIQSDYRPWFNPKDTKLRNDRARNAFKSLLVVTAKDPDTQNYTKFIKKVLKHNGRTPTNKTNVSPYLSPYVSAFYDGVIVYAMALNETLRKNRTIHNGTDIRSNLWNKTFTGLITGNVSINANGDRNADYSILDLNEHNSNYVFTVVGIYREKKLNITGKIFWPGGTPPKDRPECGFEGELCDSYVIYLVIGFLSVLLMGMLAFSIFIYRYFKLEADIARMTWKVNWEEVIDISQGLNKRGAKFGSRLSLKSVQSNVSGDSIFEGGRQIFIKTGFYKGTRVAIKRIKDAHIDLNRPLLLELKQMKDLQCEHLVRFVGACLEGPCYGIFTEYCPRGSLQDVLEDDNLTLDSMFRFSLMHDIVKGMSFLNSSEIRYHGNLKSTNCVVDSRFVLKLTDFGLHSLRFRNELSNVEEYAYWRGKLWKAPELLRQPDYTLLPAETIQKSDVYSFAIIVHEISFRKGTFHVEDEYLEPNEIVEKVKNGGKPAFRPSIDEAAIEEEVIMMMRRCWAEDPLDRPDFRHLKGLIRKLNKSNDSGNILDNLLSRMEQYANNLETLVQERTADYLEEKRRCEELLYQLLPKSVASQLISGNSVMAETYESVTIYFSDIVGFTSLSAQSTPLQVVELLNDLYSAFDYIIENFNVYKVETIGDAYMVVSGLPERNENQHCREIARMALRLLETVRSFEIRHRPNDKIQLRIGMHTGGCVAGVVGVKMPRYCLFGDTVNTASRMESNGLPLKIHVSPSTREILAADFPSFQLEYRGEVFMKGKGNMPTYWLLGEEEEELEVLKIPVQEIKPLTNNAESRQNGSADETPGSLDGNLFGNTRKSGNLNSSHSGNSAHDSQNEKLHFNFSNQETQFSTDFLPNRTPNNVKIGHSISPGFLSKSDSINSTKDIAQSIPSIPESKNNSELCSIKINNLSPNLDSENTDFKIEMNSLDKNVKVSFQKDPITICRNDFENMKSSDELNQGGGSKFYKVNEQDLSAIPLLQKTEHC